MRDALLKPFTGDLDEMVKRRLVRIGVTFNRTFYFVDKGVQRGVVYDYGQLVEERLNKHFKTGNDNKIHVVFVPLPRDHAASGARRGQGRPGGGAGHGEALNCRSSSTSPMPPGRTSARSW